MCVQAWFKCPLSSLPLNRTEILKGWWYQLSSHCLLGSIVLKAASPVHKQLILFEEMSRELPEAPLKTLADSQHPFPNSYVLRFVSVFIFCCCMVLQLAVIFNIPSTCFAKFFFLLPLYRDAPHTTYHPQPKDEASNQKQPVAASLERTSCSGVLLSV